MGNQSIVQLLVRFESLRVFNKITEKNPREIVLLKAFPCVWGKCRFCDYTLDNSTDPKEIDFLIHLPEKYSQMFLLQF